jgi:predicted amidohydrolase
MLALLLCVVVGFLGYGQSAARGDEPGSAPNGWKTQVVRVESAPRFWVKHRAGKATTSGYELGLAGQGSEALDGRWIRLQPVVPGQHYAFHAEYRATKVATPARSILARVVWLGANDKPFIEAEFPVPLSTATADGWTVLSGIYRVPTSAQKAQLELHLRWSPEGTVLWRNATLTQSTPLRGRKVRLATINHRPRGSGSAQDNLEQFARLIGAAAEKKPDIVCLPEGITSVGTKYRYADVAEPIPGPSTRFLGQYARKHHLYIVAGLYEKAGRAIYNTSVLLGRDGELVGKYRKVCLPREEIDGGLLPGKDYPVFDTDFGRIGMMICWDVSYPEVARKLATRGAEVILMPIAGGSEILARARAIENQIFLVASGYDFPSAIYNRAGEALATAHQDPEVAVADVDLDTRQIWPWIGDWRSRIWREAPAPLPDQHQGDFR